MKAVIQRVSAASVEVDGRRISEIKQGLCVLIGIAGDDVRADMDYIVNKVLNMRLFPSDVPENLVKSTDSKSDQSLPPTENIKQWSRNVKEIEGEVLCISQFTLLAQTKKGNKPDFHNAMKTTSSRVMYTELLELMKLSYSSARIKGQSKY
ncbi:D-Tyr tRNAtyr deacylase-like domain-containing protein [Melampsora americana]|nr:D-Tyr tRNAtyr deacylase-like domain-containing protein [Melampsora americana]